MDQTGSTVFLVMLAMLWHCLTEVILMGSLSKPIKEKFIECHCHVIWENWYVCMSVLLLIRCHLQ